MNALKDYKPLTSKELREMRIASSKENTEQRVRNARYEYYVFYRTNKNEVDRYKALEQISNKYNIDKIVILEYVDIKNKH